MSAASRQPHVIHRHESTHETDQSNPAGGDPGPGHPGTTRPATACTAFQLKSKDGTWIYLRSMEFGFPFHSQVLSCRAAPSIPAPLPVRRPGLRWKAKYRPGRRQSKRRHHPGRRRHERAGAGRRHAPLSALCRISGRRSRPRTTARWEAGKLPPICFRLVPRWTKPARP